MWMVAIGLTAAVPRSSLAGDYDRNAVMARELSLCAMRMPVEGAPIGATVRGTARSHLRYTYLAAEAQLGISTDLRPIAQAGGAFGLETADDDWQPIRGYSELGVGLFWARSGLSDLLLFHLEAGARYMVRSFERPHLKLHMGMRASTNLGRLGFTLVTGVSWSFD